MLNTMKAVEVWMVLALAGCSACGSQPAGPTTGPAADPQEPTVITTTPAPDLPAPTAEQAHTSSPTKAAPLEPAPDLPAPTAEQAAGLAAGSNALGIDLLKQAATRRQNLALSPASIYLALAMTYGGARGETAEEMARVLHHDGDADSLHEAASRVLASWNRPSEHELRVVNRLFGEQSFRFEESFLAMTRARYGAELEELDFRGAADPSRLHINAWVAGQTHDRIRDLLPPNSITPDTRMVLTNAVYFLGRWESPFEPDGTRDAPFHRLDGSTRQVPTMNQTAHFAYAEDADVQVVQMPYRGGDVAMLLVVPCAPDGLPALVQGLTVERLDGWVSAMSSRNVWIALPKVTIDPPESMKLRQSLSTLGMRLAFDPERADFSAMGVSPDPRDRLYFSEVYHKAFVRIDEEGTEAAAASAVVMGPVGAPPQEMVELHADRPFLFVLRDVRSGTVLFFGLVFDPAG